jgi:hypothetical protein
MPKRFNLGAPTRISRARKRINIPAQNTLFDIETIAVAPTLNAEAANQRAVMVTYLNFLLPA